MAIENTESVGNVNEEFDILSAERDSDRLFSEQEDPFDVPEVVGETDEVSSELAGLTVALNEDDPDPLGTYQKTKNELMATGDSLALRNVVNDAVVKQEIAKVRSVEDILIDPEATDEERKFAFESAASSFAEPTRQADLHEEYTNKIIAQNKDNPSFATIERMHQAEDTALRSLGGEIAALGEEADWIDKLGIVAPFNENKAAIGGLNRAFPEADLGDLLTGVFALGEVKERVAEMFFEIPREEWPERIEKFKEGVRENAGYFGSNEFVEFVVLSDVFDKLSRQVEIKDVDLAEGLDNLFSVVGLVDAGFVAKNTLLAANKLRRGTMISRTQTGNPAEADKLSAAGILEDEIAKAVGTDRETLALATLLPNWTDDALEFVGNGTRKELETLLQNAKATTDEVFAHMDDVKLGITPEDVEKVKINFQKRVEALAGAKLDIPNSTFELGTGKLHSVLRFSKGDNAFWTTKDAALNAAKRLFPNAKKVDVDEVDKGTRRGFRKIKNETPQEEVVRTLRQSIEDRLNFLAGARLSRGERKSLEGQIKDASLDTKTANKGRKQRIDEVQAAAPGRLRKTAEKIVDEEIIRNREESRRRLRSLQARQKSHEEVAELERNLDRIAKGELDKLEGDALKEFKALSKPRTERVAEDVVEKGYAFRVEIDHEVSEFDKLLFGDNDILSRGPIRDLILDPISKFARYITEGAERAVDLQHLRQAKLFDIAKPFVRLKNNGKIKVTDALIAGDKEGEVFSVRELQGRFELNDEELLGYFSYRQLEDVLYLLNDADTARGLRLEGNKYVRIEDETFAGVPMSRDAGRGLAAKAEHEFYDPVAKSARKLSQDELDDIYKEGGTIVRLDVSETVGNRRFSTMIVDKRLGATLDEIPEHGVTNKIPGHVSRHYKERYFITETRAGLVDGVRKEDAIVRVTHVAGSKLEAEQMVADLQKAAPEGVKVSFRHDRTIAKSERQDLNKSFQRASGVLKHSRRGEHIKASDGLADIENPVESLRRSVDAVARTVTVDRVVESLKTRFKNTFGDLTKGEYPLSADAIVNPKLATDPRVSQARSIWRYINLLEGNPSDLEDAYKVFWLRMGEWLEGSRAPGQMWLANKVKDVGDFNPAAFMRGLAFNLFIVGNPVRQLFLQSQQILFLGGLEPGYIFNPNGLIRQNTGMLLGLTASKLDTGDASILWKVASKSLGTDVAGAKKIIKSFEDTGLPFSIDAHSIARDGMVNTARELERSLIGQLGQKAALVPKLAIKGARTVGFDAGELNNLTMTWLVARQRFLRNNPRADLADRKVIEQLGADSRALALSMTKAGEFRYQKGWLSMVTQFLSVQHKAILAMTTNKFFTPGERARIAIGQVALFGTTGVGIRELYIEARDALGIEPNEHVDNAVKGGLVEMVVDNLIHSISDEKADFNVAGSFAAGGGLPNTITSFIMGLLGQSNKTPLDLLGPGVSAFNRVIDAGQALNIVFHRNDIDTPEKILKATKEFSRVFSGANNFYKIMAYKNLQSLVDSRGNPVIRASFAEVATKALVGLNPEALEDYYRLLGTPGGRAEAVNEEASRLMNYFKRDLLETVEPLVFDPRDPDMDFAVMQSHMLSALLNKHDEIIRTAISLYDEDMALAIQERIRGMIVDEFTQTRSDSLLQRLSNLASKGTLGSSIEDLETAIANSKLPNKEQYLELIRQAKENVEIVKERTQ